MNFYMLLQYCCSHNHFQIDKDALEKVLQMIDAGKKEGAKLETGGSRFGKEGYFVEPTVFSNVKDNMTIATDEVTTYFILQSSVNKPEILHKSFKHLLICLKVDTGSKTIYY